MQILTNVSKGLTTAVVFHQHQPYVSMVLEVTDVHVIITMVTN